MLEVHTAAGEPGQRQIAHDHELFGLRGLPGIPI